MNALFFAILIMMTVTLSSVRYYSVTSSFEAELDTAVQGALKQHRLIIRIIKSDIGFFFRCFRDRICIDLFLSILRLLFSVC